MNRTYNFTLNQGETFGMSLQVLQSNHLPLNLTDYVVRGQIRVSYSDLTPLKVLDWQIIDAPKGLIEVVMSADETTLLDFNTAYYDVEIESVTGVVTRIVQGKIKLSREVTK